MTQADIAAQLLNQLAGKAREISTDALYVWHYVAHIACRILIIMRTFEVQRPSLLTWLMLSASGPCSV